MIPIGLGMGLFASPNNSAIMGSVAARAVGDHLRAVDAFTHDGANDGLAGDGCAVQRFHGLRGSFASRGGGDQRTGAGAGGRHAGRVSRGSVRRFCFDGMCDSGVCGRSPAQAPGRCRYLHRCRRLTYTRSMLTSWIRDYIVLGLRLDRALRQIDATPFVDSYYGPVELRSLVDGEADAAPEALSEQAAVLDETLAVQGFEPQRQVCLAANLRAMRAVARLLADDPPPLRWCGGTDIGYLGAVAARRRVGSRVAFAG